MRGFSKAIITGNLTRDPELRTTPNGNSVCSFTVAVNRNYRDASGEQKEDVSFIDCSAWGKLGETIGQYARKGSCVLVSGRLDQRNWDDKNTGLKRSRVEIVAEELNFISPNNSNHEWNSGSYAASSSAAPTPASTPTTTSDPEAVTPDDIPEGEIDLSEVPF